MKTWQKIEMQAFAALVVMSVMLGPNIIEMFGQPLHHDAMGYARATANFVTGSIRFATVCGMLWAANKTIVNPKLTVVESEDDRENRS